MHDAAHPIPARRLTAIACCLSGVICLCVSDALAKSLTAHYSPLQLLFVRAALAFCVLLVVILPWAGPAVFRTDHLRLHGVRAVFNVGSACFFYLSLTALPLATATAVAFCAPLFVFVYSVFLFKEKVARGAWLSLALGIAGVLLALRPTVGSVGAGAVFALLAAWGYATLMVSARWIKGSEPMGTLVLYIVLGQLAISALFQPWAWQPVDPDHLPKLAGLAFFSTAGLTLITQAFRTAPASLIAPLEYSGLLWAALLGWLYWNEQPDAMFFAGAALIVISGSIIAAAGKRPTVPDEAAASPSA